VWTSGIIITGYAIPGFLFAILLIILFAGGSFFNIFPLRGLTSDYWAQLSLPGKVLDYFWHLVLPIISMGLAAFATMTLLTKNSFLDEIRKQYVLTARAKGCTVGRSAHRFRDAGGVRWTTAPPLRSRRRRRRPRWGSACCRSGIASRCRRSTAGAGRVSRRTGAAIGRSGCSWRCS
jgi:hypothetical protein